MLLLFYEMSSIGFEIYQEVGAKDSFTPFAECPSSYCTTNNLHGKLFMQTRGSKFTKYQQVKLQELPDQVPMGSIPRTLSVTVRGELTRIAAPGEMVTLCGVFLPKRYACDYSFLFFHFLPSISPYFHVSKIYWYASVKSWSCF